MNGLPDLERLLGPEARRSPGMQALWERIVREDGGLPNWLDRPVAEARSLHDGMAARWNAELPPVRAVSSLTVAGDVPLAAELIEPLEAVPGAILFLHGGGWAFGNLETHARFARVLATGTRMRVLALDYRHSPEHPYPAPVRDAAAAWRWLVGRRQEDPALAGPLGMAGDSAGANLAMAVMLDAARQGARQPDAALLFYGAFARDPESLSYRRFAQGFGLTQAAMTRFWDWYAAADLARDPLVAAVAASDEELRRLPPLFLNAAGLDPLLCDTYAMAARLRAAGAAHEAVVHEGVHHGFMQMTLHLDEAREAFARAARFWAARTGSAAARA